MSTEIPEEWYFITAPQSVSWSKDSRTTMIEPYGTNNPYVHYGTTKLRSLSLNDVMVEGFSDGVVIEENILNLEACMRMVLDSDDGFASPYVWNVYAGGKTYGSYILTGVNVSESIRDFSGLASRAKVDLSLQEVSPYQVSSGVDISAEALSGDFNEETKKYQEEQAKNNAKDQENKVDDKNKKDGVKGEGEGGGGGGGGGGKTDPNDPNKGLNKEQVW